MKDIKPDALKPANRLGTGKKKLAIVFYNCFFVVLFFFDCLE